MLIFCISRSTTSPKKNPTLNSCWIYGSYRYQINYMVVLRSLLLKNMESLERENSTANDKSTSCF